jgi:hypothetical protein
MMFRVAPFAKMAPQLVSLLIGSADVRDLRAAGKLPTRREDGRYDLLEIRATVGTILGVPAPNLDRL